MTTSQLLFKRSAIVQSLKRADSRYNEFNFLYQWSARALRERLNDITRIFTKILILSPREIPDLIEGLNAADITVLDYDHMICDPEDLCAGTGYDLILSLWDFHHMNDLPGVLICLRRALKPDGVMLSCFPGGETLHELRTSLLQGEIAVLGGASPRVFPFIDKQQAGALLQRTGFALPVVDSDIIRVSYRDIFHLMADLRGMGERNILTERSRHFTPSRLFFEAGQYYAQNFAEADGRLTASFEIIFMIGWAPHDSQQKPAKRGTGQVSLTDILEG